MRMNIPTVLQPRSFQKLFSHGDRVQRSRTPVYDAPSRSQPTLRSRNDRPNSGLQPRAPVLQERAPCPPIVLSIHVELRSSLKHGHFLDVVQAQARDLKNQRRKQSRHFGGRRADPEPPTRAYPAAGPQEALKLSSARQDC